MFPVIGDILGEIHNKNVYYWYQEANADLNLAGGNGYVGYSSNYNNIYESSSYTICEIDGSDFTPVSLDVDGDGMPDIVTTGINSITAYNLNCEVISQTTIPGRARAMPILINPYPGGTFQKLLIVNESHVSLWFANTESPYPAFTLSYNANAELMSIEYNEGIINWITCNSNLSDEICIAMTQGTDDVFIINWTSRTIEKKTAELDCNAVSHLRTRNGIALTRTVGNTQPKIPFCFLDEITKQKCEILDGLGNSAGITIDIGISGGGEIDALDFTSAYIARVGGLMRLLIANRYKKSHKYMYTAAFNLNGDLLHDAGSTTNMTSNWMVGDYDKDGSNEACYLVNNTANSHYEMRCYGSSFSSPESVHDFSDVLTYTEKYAFSNDFVMADFDPDQDYLAIAGLQGIYVYNGTGIETIIDSGYSQELDGSRNGTGIVINQPGYGIPAYVYTTSSFGFIARDTTSTTNCGNGVCDTFESSFSCPQDCGMLAGDDCITSADCPTNYPVCINGLCVVFFENAENFTFTCNSPADCPITEPLCIDGFCSSGVSGGVGSVNESEHVINRVPSPAESDEYASFIYLLFGGSVGARLIAGIVIIIGFLAIGAQISKNPVIILLTGIIGLVFSTIMNLIPIYVLILLLLGFVLVLVIKQFLFPTR